MNQIFISVSDESLHNVVLASLNLYREVFDMTYIEVHDPYCASMLIVDSINKEFEPKKTIVLGFEVQGYTCVADETDHMQILKAIRLILNQNKVEPQSIVVKSHRISVKSIRVIETQGRNVIIHTKNEKFSTYRSISYWKKLLWMWPFEEVFRGVLINMDYVESYTSNRVTLNDRRTFPISRRNLNRFKKVMEKKDEEAKNRGNASD